MIKQLLSYKVVEFKDYFYVLQTCQLSIAKAYNLHFAKVHSNADNKAGSKSGENWSRFLSLLDFYTDKATM